jgi:hypothetical protein
MAAKQGKAEDEIRYGCPKCGVEVARRAMLCPNCREPLTGSSAPVKLPPRPKAAPAPAPSPKKSAKPAGLSTTFPGADPFEVDEEEPSGPPLGRAVDDRDGVLKSTLNRIEGLWASKGRSQRNKRTVIAATIFASLGVILLARVLIQRPWVLPLPQTRRGGDVSVLDKGPVRPVGGQTTDGQAVRPPGKPTVGVDSTAEAPAPAGAAPSGKEIERGRTLLAGAEQLERLSKYLVLSPESQAPPVDPRTPEDVLPPIPEDEIPGPSASPDAKNRFETLLISRENLAMEIAQSIIRARTEGLTADRALVAAAMVRRRAEALLGGESYAPPPSPAYSIPPGAEERYTEGQIEDVIGVLLGSKAAGEVLGILRK